jgi:hypothetical protein
MSGTNVTKCNSCGVPGQPIANYQEYRFAIHTASECRPGAWCMLYILACLNRTDRLLLLHPVPMKTCHACNKKLSGDLKAGRKDACPFCGADLRCCLNCRFYDPAASKQCRETVTELVREKAKANFCDYFVFVENRTAGTDAGAAQARAALNDLFKR